MLPNPFVLPQVGVPAGTAAEEDTVTTYESGVTAVAEPDTLYATAHLPKLPVEVASKYKAFPTFAEDEAIKRPLSTIDVDPEANVRN